MTTKLLFFTDKFTAHDDHSPLHTQNWSVQHSVPGMQHQRAPQWLCRAGLGGGRGLHDLSTDRAQLCVRRPLPAAPPALTQRARPPCPRLRGREGGPGPLTARSHRRTAAKNRNRRRDRGRRPRGTPRHSPQQPPSRRLPRAGRPLLLTGGCEPALLLRLSGHLSPSTTRLRAS